MPAPMTGSIGDYLKRNAKFAYGGGALGGVFLASDLKNLLDADNKMKALLKTMKDFILIRVAAAGVFTAVSAAIKSLVRDTGALEAALKRLGEMQILSRQMAAFTGGLNSARQRVAQLQQLSERGPFKFEDIAEANKQLEVFTRGTQSSIEATQQIGQAAIASGNNIADVARSVGQFYDNLQSGQPVGATAEQMRQMGLISASTARKLEEMASGGESVINVMGELNTALAHTAQGTRGYQDELETVTAEHEKAAEALKAKFGAPWTEKEIQNTQNYTRAIKSITPALAEVSKWFAALYNGFSTFVSSMVRMIAGSKGTEVAIKALALAIQALTLAALAYGTYAALQLTPIILRLGGALAGMNPIIAGVVASFRGLAFLTVWGIVAAGIGTVVTAMVNLKAQTKAMKQGYDEWVKAHEEATKAILAEAAAITTLAEKQTVLAKSHQKLLDLGKEDREIGKRRAEISEKLRKLYENPFEFEYPGMEKALRNEDKILEKKQKRIRSDEDIVKQSIKSTTATDTVHTAMVEAEAQRQLEIETATKGVDKRAVEARKGLQERAKVEKETSDLTNQQIKLQKDLEDRRASAAASGKTGVEYQVRKAEQFAAKEVEITDVMKKQQAVALGADPRSAVFLEAKAQQLREARTLQEKEAQLRTAKPGTPEEIQLRAERDRARQLSGGIKFNADELHRAEVEAALARRKESQAGQFETESREARFQRFDIETEIKSHQARRRGDIRGAQAMEDIGEFAKTFQQFLPIYGEQQARELARQKTEDKIQQEYFSPAVVSSLQAIGGGGNVGAVDPNLESARRREILLQEINENIKKLVGDPETGAIVPTFAP